MDTLFMFLALLGVGLAAGFLRVTWRRWSIATGVTLALFTFFGNVGLLTLAATWLVFAVVAAPLNYVPWRQQYLTKPVLGMYRKMVPKLSETEEVALHAGTVGWEGELFAGKPDFKRLLAQPEPELTAEERAFLDGPCETVCGMVDDWEVTHELADLNPETWRYLKDERFFGMIIPREYGGLGFSARAHSAVLQKLSGKSATLSSTVAVPNSLGPAELILHYGTDEQKNHYLPRLAKGEEIPCFGLTGPTAGSDATSIPDVGIVTKKKVKGKEVLGISLTFDKRYITLAPVATVVGLAFQLKDPDGLLGEKEDIGISLALVPRDTKGMEIGKRHFPLNIPFMNGPIRGESVFVPIDYLIGGTEYAGQGWRMLVECLSVGRAISLPSSGVGGMKAGALGTGAYARMRKQFGMPIGRFEGIEEALARIGGYTYAATALARATAAAVDRGEKPAVPSAIAKYHATELAREVARDVMDVQAGKAVILGPKNMAGRGWQASPIAITVEGANIMTRSLMIFGQGAIRCHPFVLPELFALREEDPKKQLKAFDKALWGHVGLGISNACRSVLLAVTGGRLAQVPGGRETKRYYRSIARYSAALGLTADIAMLTLGGKLKFKERLSARLGDVLSQLYIMSSMLKKFEDQGRPAADLPFLVWACEDASNKMQVALDEFIRNFPIKPVAWMLRALVFPTGKWDIGPVDRQGHKVAALLLSPSESRDRLTWGVYKANVPNNPIGFVNAMLGDVIKAEPIERKLVKAVRAGDLESERDLEAAVKAGIINDADRDLLLRTREAVAEIIAVDEFEGDALAAGKRSGTDDATKERVRAA
ncbi:MAG: acyl-CoA dehydrogenase [Pseudomonadota bacterium]